MKRISTFIVALLCAVSTVLADGPFRNHRYDSFKALSLTSNNILFIGNSITDMHCWPEVFVTNTGEYLPIVNRGNSGTYSTEQSDNLESYINGKPKKVFMMIGTNDIATSGGLNFSPEQVLAYVKSIVTRIHARSPQTKIYLYSILKNNTSNRVEATWLKANELTQAYADATDKVTYIDLYDKLANVADGGAWSYDKLHLTAGAYQVWASTICQYLAEDEDFTVSCVYPANTIDVQNRGGLGNASHGMRATYFSCLPIKSDDVLVFGDSFIKNGEWQEFLGNRNVKNRGTGWGNSGEISTTSGIVDATFATIDGVTKTAPKAMFLYTGTADACGSTDIETVKANYLALVNKLAEKAPNAKIYLMAICPRNNASHNTRIAELNAYMESIATGNIRFVDTYSPFINEGTVNSKYVFSNDYIGGLAYIKIANLMKTALLADFPSDTYNVTSDADAEVRYAQAGLRNQLTQVIARGLVATRGNEAGQYNATAMAAFDEKLAEASTLLEKSSITQDEVTAMANSLNTILNEALSMPTYSTQGNDVWYQLFTPGRGNKYLTSTGAGANVTSSAANNYATSMWKFVNRNDSKGLDIINRHDGSYLAPTAAGSSPLSTSASQPANGWSLSYSDTPGLFIISSGSVQIHQTNNVAVWNWGGGSNRSDAGCQYQIEAVEGEPDEIPDPSVQTLTLTPTEFQKANGKSTWTYHGTTTSGGWYGKFVTGTTPALTVESTDLTVNNIGWSNNRPWLKAGYTYNLTIPENYIITSYELTTLSSSSDYSNTFTYTTAEGTGTSEAQSSSTAKTITASNLNKNKIVLTVNGEATNSNYGILITNLVIHYKEVLPTLTYTIDKENGNLYKDNGTSANQSWNSAWRSNAEPQLVFSCPANNMNWVDNNVQMMAGQAGSATYTLTAPEGYVIGSYNFTFANNNHDTGLSLAMTGGNTYTTTLAAQTISARNQKLSTMSFVLSGTNGKGVILTNFTVTFVDPAIAGKEEIEEEDPELTAAKTEAKATVTANAAKLDDALGYYSYTIDGVKVYDASEVTATIDAATTVAEVEAILATYSLNLPEVGKYYRIKGHSSGKYLDAVNRHSGNQMGMKTEAERDFLGSIFLLDEGSKFLNMGTNTYIKDTHSIGADKAGANTWTFEASPRTLGCILLKSSGSSPYLHDSGYANRCSGDGGHAAHDFILEEVEAYSLTVEAPALIGATATWNGETKTLPAVWALFEGTTITGTTLTINGNANYTLTGVTEGGETINGNTIEIESLTANRTITANFTPAFFSASTDSKDLVPVHIYNMRNKNYTICLNEANNYAGHAVNSGKTDYTLDEVWYLVGTAESFKMYSKTAGMDLALTLAGTGSGSAATMTATGTALCLNVTENGYNISPVGTPGQSFNMHGAAGNDIKLYGATDGGAYWGVNIIDITKPLTLNVAVSGSQPYETNYRVANLSTTIAGQSSTSIITGGVAAHTYYLPAGSTFTLNNSYLYRGYTFDGFKDAQGNTAEYADATIPAGGLSVTASYSVDENNKYQYLYYSNDPVMNKPYRIPAVAVTRTGRILAVTDHRPGGSDVGFAPVDIKIRYSEDNGQTWSDEKFIADGTGQHVTVGDVTHTNVFDYAFGDAAIVADRESDEVLIMCVGGKQNFPGADATHHNYTARLRSHDGGVTWDAPENVTANFMDVTPLYNNENPNNYEPILPEAYSLFYGSGRIVQSRVFKAEGSQYYRIYAALLVREVREGDTGASHNNYVVYSDNFGETWNLLGNRCVNGGDEAKVEELPDGTIIISSRKAYGRYFNVFTFTDIANGVGEWSTQVASETITGGISYGSNACNGEIFKVKAIRNSDKTVCDVMMQSVPTGQRGDYTADGRNDVTIFFKEMVYGENDVNTYTPTTFAENWMKGLVVSRVRSAYSTMDIQADGKIAFFYEEDPESYCMVYVPLTLEEITNGAYSLYEEEFTPVELKSAEEFENGGVYTFVTARGQMGATESGDNVISTARTSVADTDTDYFKWTVYKSTNGNYYLYNLGKQMFMGVQSANNTEIAFVETPAGKKLTFKQSSSDDYPIMFSTDNAAVVNHSTNHGGGLISWTGGWNTLNDGGSNHKVTLVARLSENELATIAAKVENYDRSLPIKVEVEGWTAENPNTHFGTVTATTGGNVSSTKLLLAHMTGGNMAYSNIDDEVAFTRAYRGFEFLGFKVGEQNLGKSFTLTEAIRSSITAETPLIAKFTATSDVTLFYDDDPFSYRIPAIATTSTGRLIAVSDYRYSLDDIGRYNFGTANPGIDLVIRTSDDNGKTWSATKTIAKGSCVRDTDDCAYGDAAIAVVGEKVLVMAAAGDVMFGSGSAEAHNRAVRVFSEDNGVTWTKQDISETLFLGDDATIKNGYTSFFGSGRLAVDENYNGTGKARIYGALLLKKASGTGNYVIYTDDLGLTWNILGGSQDPIANQDEPKVEILPSGQILLSVRRNGGRQFNVFTYTDKATNAGSWDSNVNGCGNGGSNTCNGEPFVVDAKDANGNAVKLLLQSQPKGGSGLYDRRDVTIWYKKITDDNYTSAQIAAEWTQGLQVSTQQSAYSAMTLQDDGKIAFFFEEAPCYGDDQAKGYCMVYVPLTIEDITKANYFAPETDFGTTVTIDVELSDAEGNVYRDQIESPIATIGTVISGKYPFIVLGDNVSLTPNGATYTYRNTVMLPFRVSNNETTVWNNIYFLSNKINQVNYPVYLSASTDNDEYVATCKDNVAGEYGDNSVNTLEHADKISWAAYSVDNGFAFKFKNKLTGKFIQVTSVATGNSKNVKYVDEANATTFELVPQGNNFYAVKANVGGTDGYLCCTSAGYGFATHFERYNHAGGTVTFAEVDDFEKLIAEVNTVLSQIGTSLGKYSVTDANAETAETAKDVMENSSSVKLNDLIAYRDLLSGATLNMPKAGQYFRVAYDYGGSVGKLYMQGVASSVKGVQFSAETGDASIWVYLDGSLYSYTAGKNLREHGDERGLHDTKTTAEFSASTRAKGKYNIKLGSWLHANSNNGNYYSDHCGSNNCAEHDLILEEVAMNTSTIGIYKIGTYYANHATIIPDGVTAYIANQSPIMENGTGVITMTKITDGIIPAQTGVVIRGAEGTYTFESSDEQGTTNTEENLMVGYAGVQKSLVTLDNDYATYVLTVQDDKAGFYKKNANFNVYNNKAYLKVPNTQGAVMSIRLRFDNEGTTDIIEVPTEVLNMNGEIYDLSGRRVEKATKGVYIVNGKKVIF